MLFTRNRAHDCPLKRSFNKIMQKYRLSDVPKRLSSGQSDEFSETTDITLSTEELKGDSSELVEPCAIACMNELRRYCLEEGIEMSNQELFRFACFHQFNVQKAKDAVDENRDNAFLDLEMKSRMRSQFMATKLLFPLTGLTTKKHHSQVIYTRASRCKHADDDMTKILESLCYVMNDFSQTEEQCRNGVAIVTNMEGFQREQFDPQDWHQFLMALQGGLVPTKVTLVLLVNPPSWFEKDVWKKMKSSMLAQFRKNMHIITSDKLGDYLMEDYRAYLPTELDHGYRFADEVIEDYVDLKEFQDQQKRNLIV